MDTTSALGHSSMAPSRRQASWGRREGSQDRRGQDDPAAYALRADADPADRASRLRVLSGERVEVGQEIVERGGAERRAVGGRDDEAQIAALAAVEAVFHLRR